MAKKSKTVTTITYDELPSVVVQPKKEMKRKPLAEVNEDLEEGEIVEDANDTGSKRRRRVDPSRQFQLLKQIQALPQIKELCPTYCNKGFCTSNCQYIHDPNTVRLCKSVLEKRSCKKSNCKLTHQWSFNVAPTCIAQLLGRCTSMPCVFAHNDFVHQFSDHCTQFGRFGCCEQGASCTRLHLTYQMASVMQEAKMQYEKQIAQQAEKEAKLAEAREKAKRALAAKRRPAKLELETIPQPKTSMTSPAIGRLRHGLGEMKWPQEVEEVHGGETKGELAAQADFVPFC